MALESINIETRVELAVLELLKADAAIVSSVGTAAQINVAYTYSTTGTEMVLPAIYVQMVGFTERTNRTGWYIGTLRLGAVTRKAKDKDTQTVKNILGYLRGWVQQDDLAEQITNSVSAAPGTNQLTCTDIRLDGPTVDFSAGKINELAIEPSCLVRPSK